MPSTVRRWTSPGAAVTRLPARDEARRTARCSLDLPAGGTREFVVKLPRRWWLRRRTRQTSAPSTTPRARGPAPRRSGRTTSPAARSSRARRRPSTICSAPASGTPCVCRGGTARRADVKIDLPYSNFAYEQTGTPWPVNQAVYVDYMLYDLRGYHDISAEELLAHLPQQPGAQRPRQRLRQLGRLHARHAVRRRPELPALGRPARLSRRLLPASLKALDWCLRRCSRPARGRARAGLVDGAAQRPHRRRRLGVQPGLHVCGPGPVRPRARRDRASRARPSAGEPPQACARPSSAVSARRHALPAGPAARPHLEALRALRGQPPTPAHADDRGIPTDVDTGAVHLLRLKAHSGRGDLADWLLNDHEDNLYLQRLGHGQRAGLQPAGHRLPAARRPEAVIRTFYSFMACAFSHCVFEPVEHRWTHGQYFGPPSTDGAWFELYRNMLIHERDDGALVLGQATPRAWLADGKKIVVERAPTYYGDDVDDRREPRRRRAASRPRSRCRGRSRPPELLVPAASSGP